MERLWLSERQTVLFITHSIEEAVGLSDRVVAMSPSPGRIVREMGIDLPRPRPLALGEAPALEGHVQAIYRIFEEMGVLHGKNAGSSATRSGQFVEEQINRISVGRRATREGALEGYLRRARTVARCFHHAHGHLIPIEGEVREAPGQAARPERVSSCGLALSC